MKAQRATVELGTLGGWCLAAGVLTLARVAGRGVPEFGLPAAVLGALVLACSIYVIGMSVRRLNAIEGLLPETVQRVSWPWVATRASLAVLVPIGTVAFLATSSDDAAWTLGLAYAVLGGAICAAAVLATHVEHLCGARVWRSDNRFYFAR